jgi:hypothetical protein
MFVGLVVACILLDSSSSSINPAFSITPWVTSKTVMALVDRSCWSRCMCSSSLTLQCYLLHINNLTMQKSYVIRQFTVLPLRANWARLWVLILRVSRLKQSCSSLLWACTRFHLVLLDVRFLPTRIKRSGRPLYSLWVPF